MKVVILAGGLGTRISEESFLRPKPMIEIGQRPMLWHIMKLYSQYGHNEFVICAGYMQHVIKEYFATYALRNSDITFDFETDDDDKRIIVHSKTIEPWKVTVIDTGLNTLTGGRVRQVEDRLGDEPFLLTYGDGVADVDIAELVRFHEDHGKLLTMTAVRPEGRFGALQLSGNQVVDFREKSDRDVGWVNGGFMVCEPEVLGYIEGDQMFERQPMEHIATDGQMVAFKHHGFWQCMDTLRDKERLETLWASGSAPWKTWD